MKSTLITAFFISGHLAVSNCRAAESPSSESPVVATVLGRKITAADVGLPCDVNQKPLIPQSTPPAGSQRNPMDELGARIEREISGDYIKKNIIHSDNVRREFWKRMGSPPALPAKPDELDLTPYWKKPLR